MRRTRSTSQMESGVPLSRMALRSRLVGPCKETSFSRCASRAPAIAWTSAFAAYSKWLRVQKTSTPWNLASRICPRSSGVNFRDTNKYVESSLCMIASKNLFRLVSHGRAFVARIGGAQPFPGLGIDSDGVHQADVAATFGFVASRGKFILQAGRELILYQNLVRKPLVMKSWSVD